VRRQKRSMQQLVDQLLPTAPKREMEEATARVWIRLEEELKKRDTSLRSLYSDGWSVEPLENREFRALTAVSQLGECRFLAILRLVENWAGGFSFAHVMILLDELQQRKFVTSLMGEGTNGRTLYKITCEGERALRRANLEGKPLIAPADEVENRWGLRAR
jgi:DNA-binding PadR family transcriptional regulator